MAELRKISKEELREILAAHKLWLERDGEQGQRADLSNCDLLKADLLKADLQRADLQRANLLGAKLLGAKLQIANLQIANLQGADLQRANLKGADLKGADLKGADLKGVNLEYAKYALEQFDNVEPDKRPEIIRLHQQNKFLNEQLKDRIGKAKESLETSLKTTKERIEHNTEEAKRVSETSEGMFLLAIVLLIIIPIILYCVPPSKTIKQLGTFAALLYTLPVVATLLIGTTLLRHHKKLQDEIRHFSDQQQRIELYSGLLEASQHAAAAFHKENNNRAAEELVEETFKAIRSRLLSEQAAAAAERSQESDEDPPLLNKLTDIVGKLTEAAAKSCTNDKN